MEIKRKLKDITKECRYEECEDNRGKFYLITYKGYPLAELRITDGWFKGKRIAECFKVYFDSEHPEDYCWINFSAKGKL